LVLNKWYHSSFFGHKKGAIFFSIFVDYFVEGKKRVATFRTISLYFFENFAENGCISKFLLEKHPKIIKIKIKNHLKWSPGIKVIDILKIYYFQGFLWMTARFF
jgi:hypothetical protein